ncbi:perlucin-like protein [Polypterus senegalus]|uniref:perlucin-like protein n=1 Tax=Polypterus senegalus TaxID=55291 RepID=UPI00196578A3|nr:perlucin-like protein [Polypterus senegalus]
MTTRISLNVLKVWMLKAIPDFTKLNDKQQQLEELKSAHYNLTNNYSERLGSLATFQSQYEILNKSHAELLARFRKLKSFFCSVESLSQGKTCLVCPEGWVFFQSKCYFFSNNTLTWQSSQEQCLSMGGHLVIVESAEEESFLENKTNIVIEKKSGYWIGLTDQKKENQFVWVDNKTLDTNTRFWEPGEPGGDSKENCVQIWAILQQKRWHDFNCESVAKRICETNAFLFL